MRSKDFITEAPPAKYDDSGNLINDPNAKRAETPDWLKNAGKWLGNKIGLKEPIALPDYTATDQEAAAKASNYRGIDPVIRKSLGMAPATQQEIDAYVKANPAVVGGLTDRNGNPIVSGGAQELERAARAAAPRRGADFDVDSYAGAPDPAAVGDRFYTPRELGFQPGGSMPGEKKAAAAAVVPAPAPEKAAVVRPAAVAQPEAVIAQNLEPAAELPSELPSGLGSNRFNRRDQTAGPDAAASGPAKEPDTAELARIAALAGVKDPTARAEEPPVAVKDRLAAVDSGSLGRAANAGVAAAAPATTGDPTEFIRDKSNDVFEPIKKPKVKPKPKPQPNKEPAVPYVASGGTGGGSLNNPQDDMVDGTYIPDPNTGGYTATYLKKPGGQQNTTPAVAGNPVYTRLKTVADVDNEIQRFINKGSDMRLPANQQYLNNLTARRAELSGSQPGSQTRQNAEPAPAATGSVTVKPGDTLSKIAAANGTTLQAIMAANPSIKDPNKIAIGQNLKIREAVDIGRMRFLAGLTKD